MGWGFEDNKIYDRCIQNKIAVNRDIFYNIFDEHFIYQDEGDKTDLLKTVSDLELNLYQSRTYGAFNVLKILN